MQRTESKSIQVHPSEEQFMINVMQEFAWNLKSSQEIKLRSQEITGVNSGTISTRIHSEHYIKLVFERPYDFPNRERLVELESEFFNLRYPETQSYTTQIIIGVIALICIAFMPVVSVIVIVLMALWIYATVGNNKKSVMKRGESLRRRDEIIREATLLSV